MFDERVIAARRFGLGTKPGELGSIGNHAKSYLLAQLAEARHPASGAGSLRDSATTYTTFTKAARAAGEARKRKRRMKAGLVGASAQSPDATRSADARSERDILDARRKAIVQSIWRDEISFRVTEAITTGYPLVERLALFWSNHFAVSVTKSGQLRVLAGAFEREAIRPHVLGHFKDMLRAVEQHPAMLLYLDNHQSVGPNSPVGSLRRKGLNENLGREILELHTVGVNAGYTQTDVTNASRIITGWTVSNLADPYYNPGHFVFQRRANEPGEHTVLGRNYVSRGRETGEQWLDDLARHPSTAHHVASKLARHFLSDTPPEPLVKALAKTFLDTEGHLGEVAKTLVSHDAVWRTEPRKIIPPYDYLISIARGFNLNLSAQQVQHFSAKLGQPIWAPPSPKGWPDSDQAWMGPSEMKERLRLVQQFAPGLARRSNPVAALSGLLGNAARAQEKEAVARAETPAQGFELLMLSPSFQRR